MTAPTRVRFRFDDFEIDTVARVLERGGAPVPVSRKASEVLLLLLARSGQVITKEELFAGVWPDVVVDENNLSQCVSALRRALGDDASNPRFVATVARRGFRFVGAVARAEGERPEAAAERPVVAVIPFRAEPASDRLAALGAGLAEELTAGLAGEPALLTRPVTSVLASVERLDDAAEIGRRLGARFVLTGVVRESAGRLKISAEWVRVADGVSVWADRFADASDDLFALEERIAARIVSALPFRSAAPAGTRRPALALTPPSRSVDAYLLYLRGRHFANQLTRHGFVESGAAFELAIQRDPEYALAWEGLAYRDLMAFDLFVPPVEIAAQARRAAERALELDASLTLARCALVGLAVFCDWDRAAAERGIHEILALGEPAPSAAREVAWFLALLGRFEEAAALFDRARELEPVSLEQAMYHGAALQIARRHREARPILEATLDAWPETWLAHVLLGRCDEAEGDLAAAIARYQAAARAAPEIAEPVGDLARALGRAGRRAEAERELAELEERRRREFVPPHALAQARFGLGDLDGAFAELERAFAERSWYLSWIRLAPTMDPWRRDPRFAALVRRIGL